MAAEVAAEDFSAVTVEILPSKHKNNSLSVDSYVAHNRKYLKSLNINEDEGEEGVTHNK